MCSSKTARIALLVPALCVLALGAAAPAAMAQQDTLYRLTLFTGGGFTRCLSAFEPEPLGLQLNGFSGFARVMWQPEHLLSVGLEVGYHRVYGAEVENLNTPLGPVSGSSNLAAIPVQIIISLPVIGNFALWTGTGFAILVSDVDFFGSKTSVTSYTPYLFAAASYLHPVAKDLKVGADVGYYYADRYIDEGMSFHVMLAWTFHAY